MSAFQSTYDWKSFAQKVIAQGDVSAALKEQFHLEWTVEGHWLRQNFDDDSLLAEFLWRMLPRFSGEPMILFRGENLERLQAGRVGFCWSSDSTIAQMFGRGLNAFRSGGILLKIEVGKEAIIAGPSAHSQHLGEREFTVDPRRVGHIQIVERYPPI